MSSSASSSSARAPPNPANAVPASATKKQISKFEQAEHVHRQLLYDLMSSIYEYVVVLTSHRNKNSGLIDTVATATVTETGFQTTDTHTNTDTHRLTPNIESLLIHINSCLEHIFLNGLRIFKPDVSINWCQIWFFCTKKKYKQICSITSSDLHL